MGLETGTYISDLNSSNPGGSDVASQGDDHIRLLKSTIKATFPNVSGAVTATHTELNYIDGVTSNIQTQFDNHTTSIGQKLPLAGGTMTGDIILAGAPSNNLHPATKSYVDTADALLLPKAGGTMTGDLVLAGAPNADLKAATKKYVDDAGAALEASFGDGRVLAAGVFVGTTGYYGTVTYARSGTTVTVTLPDHPYLVGSILQIAGATDTGLHTTSAVVTGRTGSTFTFETAASGAASGSLTVKAALIKGHNISAIEMIADSYLVKLTFTDAAPDENYIVVVSGYYNPYYQYADALYHDRASGTADLRMKQQRTTTSFQFSSSGNFGWNTEFNFIASRW